MSFLVIVESPNKIKKIQSILGNEYKVMASSGHIRGLPKKSIGINLSNYEATYEITNYKIVNELKKSVKSVKTVYIATDPDREGEGIAWHLMEVLNLSHPKARRMAFNEITNTAIQNALVVANKDGKMNMDAVDSYKARCFVDKITGFKASPLLWKNVQGAKSAGRVQSVATELIVDRENIIKEHVPEEEYIISGIFLTKTDEKIYSNLHQKPKKHEEAIQILSICSKSTFSVSDVDKKSITHSPPQPFKTSVYQQEAGKRYGLSPKVAMSIAQKLYEKGKITYHRTDITRLSDQFKNEAKDYIISKYGIEYLSDSIKKNREEKKECGVQAAHEAIRPTNVNIPFLNEGHFQEIDKSIYHMIWVQAVSSLMANERCDKYSIRVVLSKTDIYWFVANYLLTTFSGFKILQKTESNEKNKILMSIQNNDILRYESIESRQTYTKPIQRFTESSLVKELENKGIGRPSTYATIISTIQKRNYVIKKQSTIEKKDCIQDTLKGGKITNKIIKVDIGDKKQRLFPTELGNSVTLFLLKNLELIMDYNFTSSLEKELDDILERKKNWFQVVDNMTKTLEKMINKIPPTEKIKKEKMSKIIGIFDEKKMEYNIGPYGPYVKYNKKCYSLPKECSDISLVTIEQAISAIKNNGKKYLFEYECSIDNVLGKIRGITGKFGNYIRFDSNDGEKTVNYFLSKELKHNNDKVSKMSLDDCLKQVDYVKTYKNKK